MSFLKGTVIFIGGFAVGALITNRLLKYKYETIANEEIESVKETFSNREHKYPKHSGKHPWNVSEEEKKELDDEEYFVREEDVDEYKELVSNMGYNNEREDEEMIARPYIISPEESGDCGYDLIAMTYTSDGMLLDDLDELVEDADNVVGYESLTHFGEYEDDSIFVRNDRLRADYEILKDDRTYNQIVRRPHVSR